jgi:predicted O-methyltransferase YrrM
MTGTSQPNPSSPLGAASLAATFPLAAACVPSLVASPWWVGHIPFAFELVGRLRPRVVVELGTYTGTSLAAFCRAAEVCELHDTRCYGVDLWTGDQHMGHFDEDVFAAADLALSSRHARHVELIRAEFGAAAPGFADASVDLLHIDGTHTYEAVSRDFRTWLPKMSSRGVVLLHDTCVTEHNLGPSAVHYGVARFFDEVCTGYPHIAFTHSFGLGVLLVGTEVPLAVRELVALANRPEVRKFFAQRGEAIATAHGVVLPSEPRTAQPDGPMGERWRHRVARLWARLTQAT